jgi:hypothetical protein
MMKRNGKRKQGGLSKKIASCIFLSGNAALWGTGVISLDFGWN